MSSSSLSSSGSFAAAAVDVVVDHRALLQALTLDFCKVVIVVVIVVIDIVIVVIVVVVVVVVVVLVVLVVVVIIVIVIIVVVVVVVVASCGRARHSTTVDGIASEVVGGLFGPQSFLVAQPDNPYQSFFVDLVTHLAPPCSSRSEAASQVWRRNRCYR